MLVTSKHKARITSSGALHCVRAAEVAPNIYRYASLADFARYIVIVGR